VPKTTVGGLPRLLAGVLLITRIHNCLLGAVFVVVGAYLGSKGTGIATVLAPNIFLGALAISLCIAFANVINDYHDAPADALSKPNRPIPSGRISRHSAGMLALALGLAAAAIGWSISASSGIMATALVVLSALYSYSLKNTVLLGNGLVALLDASIIVYGGLVIDSLTRAIWLASLMLFLHVFAHEILYTLRDRAGDALAHLRTTATYLGTATSIKLFRIVVLAFVTAALVPWLARLAPDLYLYTIVVCAILPTITAAVILRAGTAEDNLRRATWVMKSVWFFSILPIILLK
jgi:geranylgeranylglycerol-phosphate geranylgeranyltransferase